MRNDDFFNQKTSGSFRKKSFRKSKLFVSKSRDHIRDYHPLKRRKLKKIQVNRIIENSIITSSKTKSTCLVKSYASVYEICQWLTACGVKVKKIKQNCYLLDGKNCSISQILIIANKKRIDAGLSPFLIAEIVEHV